MFYNLTEIYVDAGCFVIGDRDWFISKGADPKRMEEKKHQYIIKCKPGIYDISYILAESWDGYNTGKHRLNIASGELWVTDACYIIRDELWMKFIDDKYLDVDDKTHFTIHTGGDGSFDIELILE